MANKGLISVIVVGLIAAFGLLYVFSGSPNITGAVVYDYDLTNYDSGSNSCDWGMYIYCVEKNKIDYNPDVDCKVISDCI